MRIYLATLLVASALGGCSRPNPSAPAPASDPLTTSDVPEFTSLRLAVPASLPLGATARIVAEATVGSVVQDVTDEVRWKISDAAVVRMTGPLAYGNTVGHATVTASWGGVEASAPLAVGAVLQELRFAGGAQYLPIGCYATWSVLGAYNDGSVHDVTAAVTWASSDESVLASDAEPGVMRPLRVGTASVVASLGDLVAERPITVTPAVVEAIAILPADTVLPADASTPLTAIGTMSDGSFVDVTTSAVWTASDAAVATFSPDAGMQGVLVGRGAGTVVVTATVGGIAGSATFELRQAETQGSGAAS